MINTEKLDEMDKIVIIGAGQAGYSVAAKLRELGFQNQITIIGGEEALPYQRPPLSKAYLTGDMARERLFFRPAQFYADKAIELRLGQRVEAIDRVSKTIRIGSEKLTYDALVLATGSQPRRLPKELCGDKVHVLRSLSDVDLLRAEVVPGRRALVIGGGYIGLELAAVAAKAGVTVTLVEASQRILQRVAAQETSEYFRELHQQNGVRVLESTGVESLVETPSGFTATLSNQKQISVDFVVAGIGVEPNDTLAREAGLACNGGIRVDRYGRTEDAYIWAAGDCTNLPFGGRYLRIESVQNAIDQGAVVAANILGAHQPYEPDPWFWSDQYSTKLQIAGLNTGYDHVVVRRATSTGARSHWYFRGEKLLSVDAINDPRSYMIGKRLIEAGLSPRKFDIANPETDLKQLLAAHA